MNLYDKIYEAVNDGIQKALILDGNDVSIKFHGKKITSTINMMDLLVDKLLNENDDEYNYS